MLPSTAHPERNRSKLSRSIVCFKMPSIGSLSSLGESNAVFLRGVGGDAATEPHKTGCWGHPEEEFSGTHNRLRPLDSADKDFLSSMCAYLGMALHNAWVHHQLLESKKNQEDLRVVRDRLAHTDKLSAMGELVAGIIHGMRNPMAIALGQCQLLL